MFGVQSKYVWTLLIQRAILFFIILSILFNRICSSRFMYFTRILINYKWRITCELRRKLPSFKVFCSFSLSKIGLLLLAHRITVGRTKQRSRRTGDTNRQQQGCQCPYWK